MSQESDREREAFSRKMLDILNFGALNLAMAIGYRTGLFDVMDAFDTPQNVYRIADRAGLDSRYVKEWLGVMATGGVVKVSSENGESRFYLPKVHGDWITRRAGSSNLGVYTQEIPLLTTCAMEAVVDGFHTGNGVHYEHYPRFQAFMSELANAKHRRLLVEKFLPSIDNGRLVEQLSKGIRVCDLGCAEGVALLLMAEAFPQSRFVGIDLSQEAVHTARKEVERQKLNNVELINLDAASLTKNDALRSRFHYVTAFDAIHDQTRPLEALKGVHHILADNGIFSMVDIAAGSDLADNLDHPMGPFLYTVSLMHCMPVGLVNGGAGLGMMWGREQALDMLKQAGFHNVRVLDMDYDSFNLHFLCRK